MVGQGNQRKAELDREKHRDVFHIQILFDEKGKTKILNILVLRGRILLGNTKRTPEEAENSKTIGTRKARKSGFLALYTVNLAHVPTGNRGIKRLLYKYAIRQCTIRLIWVLKFAPNF